MNTENKFVLGIAVASLTTTALINDYLFFLAVCILGSLAYYNRQKPPKEEQKLSVHNIPTAPPEPDEFSLTKEEFDKRRREIDAYNFRVKHFRELPQKQQQKSKLPFDPLYIVAVGCMIVIFYAILNLGGII